MPRSQSLIEKIKAAKLDWAVVGPVAAYLLLLNLFLFVWPETVTLSFAFVLALLMLVPPLIFATDKENRISWPAVKKRLMERGPFVLFHFVIGALLVYLVVMFFLGGIE